MKAYSTNSILRFGMFDGYQLGVAFVFAPSYIEWCINNIDDFFISDIDTLKRQRVAKRTSVWLDHDLGMPHLSWPEIEVCETLDDVNKNIDLSNKTYEFSKRALDLNQRRLQKYNDETH